MTTDYYANVSAKGNAPMPEIPYMEARLAHLASVGLGQGPTAESFRDLLTVAYMERDLARLCDCGRGPMLEGNGSPDCCAVCYHESLCPVCGDDEEGCRFHGCHRGEDIPEPDEDQHPSRVGR